MNPELVRNLWYQRLASPGRVALGIALLGFPLLTVRFVVGVGLQSLGNGTLFALLLGAGMIGQDVSSGVLQLVFARPVRRREYVVSRWLAVGLGASALVMLQLALGGLVLASRGAPPAPNALALRAFQESLQAFGTAGGLTLLSALAPGLGDIGLLALIVFSASLAQPVSAVLRAGWLAKATRGIEELVLPPSPVASSGAISWPALGVYLSSIALCLVLAMAVTERRELSYASG